MSRRSFYTKRLPFFGNRAMLIMCGVFFLLPFILRGAREAVDGIKNDVADWLPDSFQETTELKFFRDYFVGDQFVVVSWEGCNERDPSYRLFYEKVKEESLAGERLALERLDSIVDKSSQEYADLKEEIEARQWATELGLQTTGSYYENWGLEKEKWLQGKNKQWYFVRQDGNIFRWSGQNNLVDGASRFFARFLNGQNEAEGTFVKRFGSETNNRFYKTPELLCGRFFVDVTTGPDIFQRMAGPDGTMKVGNYKSDDLASFQAEIETHKRLTGVLFGPTPSADFDWTWDSLQKVTPEDTRNLLDDHSRAVFDAYISGLVTDTYGGDIEKLRSAPQTTRLEHWSYMWRTLGIAAPPRQTCFVVTLNEPVLDELARVVGRPVLGKPRGRILEIASGSCGIQPQNLHIGGPPVDNVAIDEEGSITLFRLVGLSAAIGLTLAWLSFRSIPVTLMLFFVGGISAIASLSIVWFSGGTLDAILMTMPSLIYVMGLSGAVHVVNYYKEACHDHGEGRAADIAVRNGIFPCLLAAFTTALGLGSLCTSNLTPIYKFGMYSAVAVMATFALLFTYLPSSLTIWPPGYGRIRPDDEKPIENKFSISKFIEHMWDRIGAWVVRNHWVVVGTTVLIMVVTGFGIAKIQTSVQLLKLFRNDAKILEDYRWMEANLGKLVPMEVLLMVDGDAALRPAELPPIDQISNDENLAIDLKLDLLQRIELSDRVRRYVLQVFGDESAVPERRVIGNVMSTDLTTPLKWVVNSQEFGARSRISTNQELEFKRAALLDQDFLRVDHKTNEELWRISLRLAALNDVDYGEFVSEMKTVVEPVLAAYRYRLIVLKEMHKAHGNRDQGKLLVIGRPPVKAPRPGEPEPLVGLAPEGDVDQTALFVNTLRDLLENSAFMAGNTQARRLAWLDPEQLKDKPLNEDNWKRIGDFDAVLVVDENPLVNMDTLRQYAKSVIVADDYRYMIDDRSKEALPGMLTAAERKANGDENSLVKASYTGIVPIVYKAQHSLLRSLIESILLSFVMISLVMMVLLRSWGARTTLGNAVNFRAGILAMLPNVFPIVVIFGMMGHVGNLVDIGSMMTASVAMGIAVDDTIHYLNWFRHAVSEGMGRRQAIAFAYRKVATAMTQTTLIAGFGLSAFAFSTFMPTQRFGIFMLFLLIAALIGDLIFLPAILASPLGKYFCNVKPMSDIGQIKADPALAVDGESAAAIELSNGQLGGAAGKVQAPHMTKIRGRLSDLK
jgi:predicted RND superfamily exporter protein